MLALKLRLGDGGKQAAHLPGRQADQLLTVVITRLACRRRLSTGADAPFERR
jgi:hypothetical protein